MNIQRILYKPSRISMVFDTIFLLLSIVVVLRFFPLTTNQPFEKYDIAVAIYSVIWFLTSYFAGRYKPLEVQKLIKTSYNLFYATIITFAIIWAISHYFFDTYFSVFVLFSFTTILFAVNYVFYVLYFAILYAADYDEEVAEPINREVAVTKFANPLDDESYEDLKNVMVDNIGAKAFNMLSERVDFRSGNTYVSFTDERIDYLTKVKYKYNKIIHLALLNNIRGINKLFATINSKLPDDGVLVCRFVSKSTQKMQFMQKFPKGINHILYIFAFIIKRFLPKIFITKRLYYDITKGKNRILSKPEVLGRLYLCGFEVMLERKIGNYNYVFAGRIKNPDLHLKRFHGPLLKLLRIGKNGNMFKVYKFRTMHPYSEYLQPYIFEKHSLKEGGKIKHDIRITTLGWFMRRYWIDELPMLINLLKGDMKVVGVRPLSKHYFELYSNELQKLRVKHKPGLLPPFYADMPKTLAEIEQSEMKYLKLCEKNGTLITDVKYFFLILKNIIFSKARSA